VQAADIHGGAAHDGAESNLVQYVVQCGHAS
jgi:hypothetical protein